MSRSGLSYLAAFRAQMGRRRGGDNPAQLHAHDATNSDQQQVNTTNWLLISGNDARWSRDPNPVHPNFGWFRAIVNRILINS